MEGLVSTGVTNDGSIDVMHEIVRPADMSCTFWFEREMKLEVLDGETSHIIHRDGKKKKRPNILIIFDNLRQEHNVVATDAVSNRLAVADIRSR